MYAFDVEIAGVTIHTNETSSTNALIEAVRRIQIFGVPAVNVVTAIVNGNVHVYIADRIAITQAS